MFNDRVMSGNQVSVMHLTIRIQQADGITRLPLVDRMGEWFRLAPAMAPLVDQVDEGDQRRTGQLVDLPDQVHRQRGTAAAAAAAGATAGVAAGVALFRAGARDRGPEHVLTQRRLEQARGGIALQAYIQPTPEAAQALAKLRLKLRERFRLATTVGYGPRFLHSTGQLHKGDRGNGLFVQLTAAPLRDAGIPDEAGKPESSMTFGVLIAAQALGDRQALLDNDRRVIRFDLGKKPVDGLKHLL